MNSLGRERLGLTGTETCLRGLNVSPPHPKTVQVKTERLAYFVLDLGRWTNKLGGRSAVSAAGDGEGTKNPAVKEGS
ncbi:hypothetical protein ACQR1I_32035 [Bradyrhizobium sp. HKCCYLS2038]|uniref:hypothetical protein n=1 Tax=unclassified Bradyrhizobium TaxID=2631580 RepID=UPI003EB80206